MTRSTTDKGSPWKERKRVLNKSKFGGGGGLPYIHTRGKKLTKNQLRAKQKGNRVDTLHAKP